TISPLRHPRDGTISRQTGSNSVPSGLPSLVRNRRHAPRLQFRTAMSLWCLLNLPHLLLKRSSGGCQHHESSSEQKHELQAPRNQESCNREGDGGYSVGGKHEHASNSPAHRNIDP